MTDLFWNFFLHPESVPLSFAGALAVLGIWSVAPSVRYRLARYRRRHRQRQRAARPRRSLTQDGRRTCWIIHHRLPVSPPSLPLRVESAEELTPMMQAQILHQARMTFGPDTQPSDYRPVLSNNHYA